MNRRKPMSLGMGGVTANKARILTVLTERKSRSKIYGG